MNKSLGTWNNGNYPISSRQKDKLKKKVTYEIYRTI